MLEWLTAWEDRVPLALMSRLMTVEVDVIIEREKRRKIMPVSCAKCDVERVVGGYDIITQIRRCRRFHGLFIRLLFYSGR